MGIQCWLITLFWLLLTAYRLIYCSWGFWFILPGGFDPQCSCNSLKGLLKMSSCKLIATFLRSLYYLTTGGFSWWVGPKAENSPTWARIWAFIFETSSNSTSLLCSLFAFAFWAFIFETSSNSTSLLCPLFSLWTGSFLAYLGDFPLVLTDCLRLVICWSSSLVSMSSSFSFV